MTLRFIDGFDHYDTAHIGAKYTDVGANVGGALAGIGFGSARHGGQNYFAGIASTNAARYIGRTLPAGASWVVGFAFKHAGLPNTGLKVFSWMDAGASQCHLQLNIDGTLSVVRSSTVLTGGTTSFAIVANAWFFIEWKVTIADSIAANSCQVRVNGAVVATVAAGQDTKSGTNAFATGFRLGPDSGTSAASTHYFDDLYICDNAGSVNNDFLGDCYVETLYPTGPGNVNLWTPSAAPNWSCVDDAVPNDDTDYLSATIVGVRDTFTVTDLASVPPSIKGVQVSALARKTDAGVRTITLVTRSGGSDYGDGPLFLADTYSYLSAVRESDPATAAPWTGAAVNAAEWGVELTS